MNTKTVFDKYEFVNEWVHNRERIFAPDTVATFNIKASDWHILGEKKSYGQDSLQVANKALEDLRDGKINAEQCDSLLLEVSRQIDREPNEWNSEGMIQN